MGEAVQRRMRSVERVRRFREGEVQREREICLGAQRELGGQTGLKRKLVLGAKFLVGGKWWDPAMGSARRMGGWR